MNAQDIFERLKGLTVKDVNGESVELLSLWSDRRVALVFLRHFG